MTRTPCFGIDLGTTASAIGLVQSGRPNLLPIAGDTLLPSVVLYRADEVLVGHPARNSLPLDPDRGVLSSKRLMGTDHRYDLGEHQVSPADVAARVLGALADGAQQATGIRPERVVITVPAWFTQAQRADTRRAGELAGLQVERIINEPTAAALAHAHGQPTTRRVLVYDLGGGTFDVSLVEQDGPLVEVKASHGDSQLGGDDIDHALTELVLSRVAQQDASLHDAIRASTAAQVRLRLAVEQAKVALSEVMHTTLRVPFLLELDGKARHLELPLDRDDVDAVAVDIIERTLTSVDQVLADAGVGPAQIDELLLVGGSTLQPLVWHTLFDRYRLEGSHAIAPRLAVALGAAIQGAIVDGSRTDGILIDVAPYALSVGAVVDRSGMGMGPTHHFCRVVTPRNSPLPARHTEVFQTLHPRQPELVLPIFQGSSPSPLRNSLLGQIRMTRLPAAPAGQHQRPIVVEFRHDLDGMVHIQVTDELSGRSVEGRIAADGEEQADLRREFDADLELSGLDVWEDEEPQVQQVEPAGKGGWAPLGDTSEARRLFDEVLKSEGDLRVAHGDTAQILLTCCRDGLAALEAGSDDVALQHFDQLSDALFEHGIYL